MKATFVHRQAIVFIDSRIGNEERYFPEPRTKTNQREKSANLSFAQNTVAPTDYDHAITASLAFLPRIQRFGINLTNFETSRIRLNKQTRLLDSFGKYSGHSLRIILS